MAWISDQGPLTESQMQNNANIVISYLMRLNYNPKTIAGILANLQAESTINPGRYESGVGPGYGLCQWTPMQTLIDACSILGISPYTDGDNQLQVVNAQLMGDPASLNTWNTNSANVTNYYNSGASSDMIGISAIDFKANSMNWSQEKLAIMFMVGFERPSYDPTLNHYDLRMQYATTWYSYMQGMTFRPRLDDTGMLGNLHWYSSGNPFYLAGYGLPNCTCYAYRKSMGRAGRTVILELIIQLVYLPLMVVSGGLISIIRIITLQVKLQVWVQLYVLVIITVALVT